MADPSKKTKREKPDLSAVRLPRLAFAASFLLLTATVAFAAFGAAQASLRQETVTIHVGQIVHPDPVSLARGDALSYDWSVSAPQNATLFFSTHIHIGPALVNLSEEVATRGTGKLVADRDGAYSVLWENRGNGSVTFIYQLRSEPAPKATPFPVLSLAVGLPVVAFAARRRP